MQSVIEKLNQLDNEIRNSDNIDVYTKVGLLSQIEDILEELGSVVDDGK